TASVPMSLGMDSIKVLACPYINHRSLNSANTANHRVVASFSQAVLWCSGRIVVPNGILHQDSSGRLVVSVVTGRFVAGYVLKRRKVQPQIYTDLHRSPLIGVICGSIK